MKFKK